MSSEILNVDYESYHGNSSAFIDYGKICGCGEYLGRWTSWTKSNPARRFIGCRNWQDKSRKCGVWEWIDPELTNYYKQQMWDLKQKSMNVESSKEVETRLGRRALKVMEMKHEIKELKRKNLELEKHKESLKLEVVRLKTKLTELQVFVSCTKGKERVQLILIMSLLLVIVVFLLSFGRGEMMMLKLPM